MIATFLLMCGAIISWITYAVFGRKWWMVGLVFLALQFVDVVCK